MAKEKTTKKAAQKKTPAKAAGVKRSLATKKVSANGASAKRHTPTAAPKVRVAVKAKASKAVTNNGKSLPGPSAELRKTYLSASELEEFRTLLMEKRRELLGDMSTLRSEAMGHGSSGENSGASSMPIHMADLGSDTWEQELTLGLIENERGLLREIDEAIDRIDRGTYGICLATNKPISKSRLRAKPWAKFCIEYARQMELGRR